MAYENHVCEFIHKYYYYAYDTPIHSCNMSLTRTIINWRVHVSYYSEYWSTNSLNVYFTINITTIKKSNMDPSNFTIDIPEWWMKNFKYNIWRDHWCYSYRLSNKFRELKRDVLKKADSAIASANESLQLAIKVKWISYWRY